MTIVMSTTFKGWKISRRQACLANCQSTAMEPLKKGARLRELKQEAQSLDKMPDEQSTVDKAKRKLSQCGRFLK